MFFHDPHARTRLEPGDRAARALLWGSLGMVWIGGATGLTIVLHGVEIPRMLEWAVIGVSLACLGEALRCAIRSLGYVRTWSLSQSLELCTPHDLLLREVRALHTVQGYVTRSQLALLRQDPSLRTSTSRSPASRPYVEQVVRDLAG